MTLYLFSFVETPRKFIIGTAVARTLIGGGGGVYSYIHVLPD